MMGIFGKLKEHMDAEKTYKQVKEAEDPYHIAERQKKRDEKIVKLIDLSYNAADDCYE